MTDSLRPLINLVESVAKTAVASGSSTTAARTHVQSGVADKAAGGRGTFMDRLASRLAGIDKKDRRQLRKVFVEVALAGELGEQLHVDPEFSELVEKVSEILSLDEQGTSVLDALLEQSVDK